MMNPPHAAERPLRILHVVDSLERGGLERVVTDLAMAQHAQGSQVRVFSIKSPGGFAQELQQAGVAIVLGDKRGPVDLRTLRALRRAMRGLQADVVHAHNFMPAYYAAAARIAMRDPAALVVSCHDMGLRLRQRKLRWIMRWALGRAERVAMVGAQVHARYVDAGLVDPTKTHSILNGVVLERFSADEASRIAARARLGLAGDALVIGSVGRLVELKNHLALVEAMPQLLAGFPGLHLVILGEGPMREALSQRIEALGLRSRVSLPGEQPDVARLLPALDVFALPSTTEGLSIALLEAAATGLPIVATDVGGNPEIVQHERTGLLVPVGQPGALRDALDGLLSDPRLRERLGRAARRWVAEQASMDSMGRAYDALYRDAAQGRRLPNARPPSPQP